jgi:hypothetical protein
MSVLKTAIVIGALGAVVGCSQSPYPMGREINDVSQQTLAGGVHWEILADHTAMKVFGCLEGLTYWDARTETHEAYCRQDVDQVRYTPIYVEQTESAVPFGEAFHRNLVTEVVERGMELSLTPDNALQLMTRVQVVERPIPLPINAWPGAWTALGTSVAVLSANFAAGAATAGIAADAYSNANSQGGSQVLVTTMLLDGSRMVMSKTDSYFIAEVDLSQYASTAPAADVTRPMKAGATPPGTRSFSVVSE